MSADVHTSPTPPPIPIPADGAAERRPRGLRRLGWEARRELRKRPAIHGDGAEPLDRGGAPPRTQPVAACADGSGSVGGVFGPAPPPRGGGQRLGSATLERVAFAALISLGGALFIVELASGTVVARGLVQGHAVRQAAAG